jgi:hypothetical protein
MKSNNGATESGGSWRKSAKMSKIGGENNGGGENISYLSAKSRSGEEISAKNQRWRLKLAASWREQ